MVSSPEQLLTPLKVDVDTSRELYLSEVDQLPQPFSALGRAHYLSRVAEAHGRPILGEYGPWIIGDSLGSPRDAIKLTTVPWLFLYHQVLAIDDMVDRPAAFDTKQMILSHLLLERAMSGFRREFGSDEVFWGAFRRYFESTATAGAHEAETFHNPERVFSSEEHLLMGRKNSLSKLFATALSLKTKGRALNDGEDDAIDALCTGFQLYDDLTDWGEDLESHNYTYPLTNALSWIADLRAVPATTLTDVTRDEVFASLILSGSAVGTVEKIHESLTQGAAALQNGGGSLIQRYVNALVQRNSSLLQDIDHTISSAPPAHIEAVVEALQAGSGFVLPSDRIWHRLQSIFRVLAGAST